MDAKEAKAITERARALQAVSGLLRDIKEAAAAGLYYKQFGLLDDRITMALTLLGYAVSTERSITTVKWENVKD